MATQRVTTKNAPFSDLCKNFQTFLKTFEIASQEKISVSALFFSKTGVFNLLFLFYDVILEKNYHENMSKFEKALKIDKQNEQFPTPEMIAEKHVNHSGLLRRGASSPALLQRLKTDKSFLNEKNFFESVKCL